MPLLREASGKVALAHLLTPARPLNPDTLLPLFLAAGLTGLEVCHSDHVAATGEHLRRLAYPQGLWWTGGSDFHGPSKPDAQLGAVPVPPDVPAQNPFPAALRVSP